MHAHCTCILHIKYDPYAVIWEKYRFLTQYYMLSFELFWLNFHFSTSLQRNITDCRYYDSCYFDFNLIRGWIQGAYIENAKLKARPSKTRSLYNSALWNHGLTSMVDGFFFNGVMPHFFLFANVYIGTHKNKTTCCIVYLSKQACIS